MYIFFNIEKKPTPQVIFVHQSIITFPWMTALEMFVNEKPDRHYGRYVLAPIGLLILIGIAYFSIIRPPHVLLIVDDIPDTR